MLRTTILMFAILAFTACQKSTGDADVHEEMESPEESAQSDWIMLFDGSDADGWRGYNSSEEALPGNWVIEDGTLKALGTGGNTDIGGDIVYGAREFDNFELSLEWKISEGGNSGIFYHVQEGDQYAAPYENAPEYQVIDDAGFQGPLEEHQKVGADYAMYVPDPEAKKTKPAGEWNTSRIVFTEEQVEYWLNGEKVVSFEPWSEDWEQRKASGKWADYPEYGNFRSGYIGLQDHGDVTWFRNIRVREL